LIKKKKLKKNITRSRWKKEVLLFIKEYALFVINSSQRKATDADLVNNIQSMWETKK